MKRIIKLACAPAVIAVGALLASTGAMGASAAAAAPVASRGLPQITVSMNGSAISVSGALRSGGTKIVFRVVKTAVGAPALIRLDPGVTVGQFFAALGSSGGDPNALYGIGAIAVSGEQNRGTGSVQAVLAPGRYVALDTSGPNPARWPVSVFTLSRAAHPAALPAPKTTVTAIDFAFRGPGTLRDGTLVRFVNHGYLVHMFVAARGSSAAVANKIATLLHEGKDNQAQALADGLATFAGPLSHGSFQQEVLNVQPGYWVIACFMNAQDGREHTVLGMERVIHIVK